MKLHATFLHSKIARRIFWLFVLCALIPITVLALISLHNVPTIPMVPTNEYRIVFTERALCNSNNGFSAGPPWVPPGANRDPMQLVPSFWATGEDLGWVEVHVSGVRASGDNGFSGRGALIFNGKQLAPVVPGVPNNAVACAAFEPTKPFTFGD